MKLNTLFPIGETDKELKKTLLNTFQSNFTNTRLSKGAGGHTQIVPADNPIHVNGFGVSRGDILQLVAPLCDDIIIKTPPEGISLKNLLTKLMESASVDERNPLHVKKDLKKIWIDLGYGISNPQKEHGALKSRLGLQLIFTSVNNNNIPENDQIGVLCYTTASITKGVKPIDPPFSSPVKPNENI